MIQKLQFLYFIDTHTFIFFFFIFVISQSMLNRIFGSFKKSDTPVSKDVAPEVSSKDTTPPPVPTTISDKEFDAAVAASKNIADATNDDKLQLYALFKQATVGPCNTPKPGVFDVVGQAKWNAWKKLGDEDAMTSKCKYVALVRKFVKDSPVAVPSSDVVGDNVVDSSEATWDRVHNIRPKSSDIAARRKKAYDLASSATRLAQFDGVPPLRRFNSLYDVLRFRASKPSLANVKAFTYLEKGETETVSFTFGELDLRARAVAAELQRTCREGDRVVLLYAQTLDFVVAFFGCIYAGVIAVPSYPPHPARMNRLLPRLIAIVEDAKPKVVLTTQAINDQAGIFKTIPQFQSLQFTATDMIPTSMADSWKPIYVDRDSICFLQYTSGSTSAPKGVMVSHFNLCYNLEIFRVSGEMSEKEVGVSWLPVFHDLGLIGGILCPVYLGFPLYLMSPENFLQHPHKWLAAMSKYRGTFSGGPNFAFDLVVRKTTPEQRAKYDLSSWRIAFCGAEPVKMATINRFCEAFPSFPRATYYPGYGLAESTLIIANSFVQTNPSHMLLKADALQSNRVIEATEEDFTKSNVCSVVSQGFVWLENEIVIVDPETNVRLPANTVGELWVRGPTVCLGYWENAEATDSTFNATLNNDLAHKWLRTGDLGFHTADGEFFITGRLKDVIIINGSNFYPQDIEWVCEKSHAGFRKGCVAAFSDSANEITIVQEVEMERMKVEECCSACESANAAIMDALGVQISRIVLIKKGDIGKTTSGKIQRRGTKSALAQNTMEVIYDWNKKQTSSRPVCNVREIKTQTTLLSNADIAKHNATMNEKAYSATSAFQTPKSGTLLECIEANLSKNGARVCFTTQPNAAKSEFTQSTLSDINVRADTIAKWVQSASISQGSKILLLYSPSVEFVAAIIGCMKAQVVPVVVQPHLGNLLQIVQAVKQTSIATILTQSSLLALVQSVSAQIDAGLRIQCTDKLPEAGVFSGSQANRSQPALTLFSSSLRECVFTHEMLVSQLEGLRVSLGISQEDVLFAANQPYDSWSLLFNVMMPLYVGCTGYLVATENAGALIQSRHITHALVASQSFKSVLQGMNRGEALSCKSITLCSSSTTFFNVKGLVDKTPCLKMTQVNNSYGTTEVPFASMQLVGRGVHHTLLNTRALRQKLVQLATEADITSGNFTSVVSQGVTLKGSNVFIFDEKYKEKLAHNSIGLVGTQSPHSDAIIHSNDIGFMTEAGEVFILGRKDEMIRTNVFSHDVSAIVREMGGLFVNSESVCFTLGSGISLVIEVSAPLMEPAAAIDKLCAKLQQNIHNSMKVWIDEFLLVAVGMMPRNVQGVVSYAGVRNAVVQGRLETVHRWSGETLKEFASQDFAKLKDHTKRPTAETVKYHYQKAYTLAKTPERLAQYDGNMPLTIFNSPAQVLQRRAERQPKELACVVLEDGEKETMRWTWGDYDTYARSVGAKLQTLCEKGDRAVMLYPQTAHFMGAFFGCLYSGVIAVPAYPPHPARLARLLPRLIGIIDDCNPKVILTTTEIANIADSLSEAVPQLKKITIIATDTLDLSTANKFKPIDLEKNDLAFLQYTSGSTSAPKGVMVS
eukprot:PhF_6_TR25455/c1_g1_i1/m.35223